jgi:IclR family transcriptional regulator, acetate operon repressor
MVFHADNLHVVSNATHADERLGGADRVLRVLRRLAAHPRGVTLEALVAELGEPKSSVHRALATLSRAGLADQDGRGGRYRLGLDLMHLVFAYYEESDEYALIQPALERLAARFGETAHYARLEIPEVVYLAKVTPPVEGVRMTSVVGGRNPAHCTGVGKALLAWELTDASAVEQYVHDHGPLVRRTPNTLVDAESLKVDFEQIRRVGYALDREESEQGINCIALPLFMGSPRRPTGAISVAAVAHRTPLDRLVDAVDEIRTMIGALGAVPVG